jgi:hypothetical protein
MASPQTFATLQGYDAVFLAGDAFDNSVLIDYVNGGNVSWKAAPVRVALRMRLHDGTHF